MAACHPGAHGKTFGETLRFVAGLVSDSRQSCDQISSEARGHGRATPFPVSPVTPKGSPRQSYLKTAKFVIPAREVISDETDLVMPPCLKGHSGIGAKVKPSAQ